jgi:hypothetical protein
MTSRPLTRSAALRGPRRDRTGDDARATFFFATAFFATAFFAGAFFAAGLFAAFFPAIFFAPVFFVPRERDVDRRPVTTPPQQDHRASR